VAWTVDEFVRPAYAWSGEPFDPDFDLAVQRHRLLEAIERSSETGAAVTVGG
jgi:hypothetical protein